MAETERVLNLKLEVETQKLEDCQNEIDHYRSHFEERTAQVGRHSRHTTIKFFTFGLFRTYSQCEHIW